MMNVALRQEEVYSCAFFVPHYGLVAQPVGPTSWVYVIFLHRGSAAKDGTEQDGESQQRQWRQKRKRRVLFGQEKQAGVLA
jgi:hypothetical protein